MVDLILRPSMFFDDKSKKHNKYALQLRYHESLGPTEYKTLTYVSMEVAYDIIRAGKAFWLFGDPLEKDRKKVKVTDEANNLWPKIKELRTKIIERFKNDEGPLIFAAGLCSGKSTLAASLMAEFEKIIIIHESTCPVQIYRELSTKNFYHIINCNQSESDIIELLENTKIDSETLVIIENAFDLLSSKIFYEEAQAYTRKILAITTDGPHPFGTPEETWSYNTWDLNPSITHEMHENQGHMYEHVVGSHDYNSLEPPSRYINPV